MQTKKYIAVKGDESVDPDTFILEAQGSIADITEASKPFKIGDLLEIYVEEAYAHNKNDALSRIEGNVIQIINGRKFIGTRIRVEIVSIAKTSAVAEIRE